MSCSTRGHQDRTGLQAGRGTGRNTGRRPWQHNCQVLSRSSAPELGAQAGCGRTKTPLPSALGCPQTSYGSPAPRAAPKGARLGWLQPCSPLHLLFNWSEPKPTSTEDEAVPGVCSHHFPQAGEDLPHGKHHHQPRPRRRGQCRTWSSSYFSQNLLVKGRQVRYSTQRQFTG